MKIHHDKENQRAWVEKDGFIAEIQYECADGILNIFHTYVPEELGGQGIAAKLVEYICQYAQEQDLHVAATCSYARIWLKRHHLE
ncbi:N-acetyltransferase [Prevotella cerevisiae]|jgi:predicted GNAT family acetyltransferase|uniref:N-acetyltransferase n=1 Tax=Segatella cerevisiae TaxID=2053716 RepID=A0ABT1BV05_9BACT|nr:GNAT family N-acetyltransferase [Segatella cerevisiae]MCH3993463.1 N-acetyltransferase [Prevotella sp.]MCO6024911.1 N-acetyltransferase [Segatella cerevisiae]